MKTKIFFVLLFLGGFFHLQGQEKENFSWAYGMLDYTNFSKGDTGVSFEAGYNHFLKNSDFFIGVNLRRSDEIILFTTPALSNTEYNAIFGVVVYKFSKGFVYLQSGAGWSNGNLRGEMIDAEFFNITYEKIEYSHFNIPVETGILFNFNHFGLGMKTFYSLNSENNIWGIGISIGYNFYNEINR